MELQLHLFHPVGGSIYVVCIWHAGRIPACIFALASVPVVEAELAVEEVADGMERWAEESAAAASPLMVVVAVVIVVVPTTRRAVHVHLPSADKHGRPGAVLGSPQAGGSAGAVGSAAVPPAAVGRAVPVAAAAGAIVGRTYCAAAAVVVAAVIVAVRLVVAVVVGLAFVAGVLGVVVLGVGVLLAAAALLQPRGPALLLAAGCFILLTATVSVWLVIVAVVLPAGEV